MDNDLILEALVDPRSDRFDQFFEIYAASLPIREQKSRASLVAMLERPDYRVLLLERGSSVLGFTVLFVATHEPIALLEYMATHESRRNAGLGALMFRESLSCADGRHLLLEVDSAREASADQELRARRQQFYRRLGCLRVRDLPYVLPLPGEGHPPLMDLLLHANGNHAPITRAQLHHWLSVVYMEVYDQSPADLRIADMLKDVTDPITLE